MMSNNFPPIFIQLVMTTTFIFVAMTTTTTTAMSDPVPETNSSNKIPPQKQQPQQQLPICIIGAGISGLSLGHLLQAKGYKTLILEKFGRVGGKIFTYRNDSLNDIQVELGPVVFSPWNDSLLKYINKFNLTSVPFNNSDALTFDPSTGRMSPHPKLTSSQVTSVLEAGKKYSEWQANYTKNGSLDFEYLCASSTPEIFQSTSRWMDNRQLGPLKPIFRILMTTEGYGALEDIAALYTLKLIDETLLMNVGLNQKGGFLRLFDGYDVLAKKMAEGLNIQLNKEVVRIYRQSSMATRKEMVVVTKGDHNGEDEERKIYKCQKVILAFPPVLKKLEKIVRNLTDEEKNVLAQVKVHKYTSAAHIIPQFKGRTVYESLATVAPDAVRDSISGHGEVILFASHSLKKRKNVYSSYSWIRGDFDELPSSSDIQKMEQKLNDTLKKFGSVTDGGDTVTILRTSERSEYFPHVTTAALEDGFYQKFAKIQGAKGLYYATTLLGFEGMDLAIKMTEGFVNKYF